MNAETAQKQNASSTILMVALRMNRMNLLHLSESAQSITAHG